jgi:hypothetical protein
MDRIPEPTNDHERAIAEALDSKRLVPDSPYQSILADVVESIPFDMSIADIQFLFNYAHWRLAQPARKQPAHGLVQEELKRSG